MGLCKTIYYFLVDAVNDSSMVPSMKRPMIKRAIVAVALKASVSWFLSSQEFIS